MISVIVCLNYCLAEKAYTQHAIPKTACLARIGGLSNRNSWHCWHTTITTTIFSSIPDSRLFLSLSNNIPYQLLSQTLHNGRRTIECLQRPHLEAHPYVLFWFPPKMLHEPYTRQLAKYKKCPIWSISFLPTIYSICRFDRRDREIRALRLIQYKFFWGIGSQNSFIVKPKSSDRPQFSRDPLNLQNTNTFKVCEKIKIQREEILGDIWMQVLGIDG